ncbi:MAG: zf-HC2 domain-containing protein [Deltaproteobacteria bacterium]|nr:zf-HC2 domain-containing protein [Deltaproteobacteria bacterium]
MNCQDLHDMLDAYLDGELATKERQLAEAHLGACSACRADAMFQQALKTRLCQAVETSAPDRLRQRLCSVLRDCERQRPWLQRHKQTLRHAAALAAGIAIVAGGWYYRNANDEAAVEGLVQASISSHRRHLPLDVQSSSGESIRSFFRDKVPFAVKLPQLPSQHARLIGARLSSLRGRDAVLLHYLVDGQRVSVFVLDPSALPREELRAASGYQVMIFRRGGAGYTVASDIDRGKLMRLISW